MISLTTPRKLFSFLSSTSSVAWAEATKHKAPQTLAWTQVYMETKLMLR